MQFRFATREDVPLIMSFIRGIAEYEEMLDQVEGTEATYEEWLFDKEAAEVLFVMENDVEVGFALFFHNFSTFVGRSGLYLEDFYVLPEYRGQGYGKALFMELVRIAHERGYGRMEWVCLDWNKPSIDFYLALGAEPLNGWTTYRLNEDDLNRLANG